jgi:hypothetical protein
VKPLVEANAQLHAQQRQAAKRTAWALAAVAFGVYLLVFFKYL